MLAVFYPWLKAGTRREDLSSFCPTRITNIVSLVMFMTILLQLPVCLVFFNQGGSGKLALSMCTLLLCILIPVLNHTKKRLASIWLLCATYLFYITASTLYLGWSAHFQYFLISGILIVPALFQRVNGPASPFVILAYAFAIAITHETGFQSTAVSNQYQHFTANINLLFLVLSSVTCGYFIQHNFKIDRRKLSDSEQRSLSLLHNTLPPVIAERMQAGEQTIADHYAEVTVIFTDISGFTKLSKHLTELQLVQLLNEFYSEVDQILLSYQIEKIKTNGDGLMAVSGAPNAHPQHIWNACEAAIRIQSMFAEFCQRHHLKNGLRIGIHTGSAVAGVLGKHKFSYDVWGETVNLAARLEQYGQAGKIQVSRAVMQPIHSLFQFEEHKELKLRGIGKVPTFWLLGRNHE